MFPLSEPHASLVEQVAVRAQATPSYLGHGVGASLATHVLVVGGYSLYLLCTAWLASADLPEWSPPLSGVRSRPQAASQAIVLEATLSERSESDNRRVVMKPQASNLPQRPTSPTAQDTPLQRTDDRPPLLAQRGEVELPETVAQTLDQRPSLPDRPMPQRDPPLEQSEPPRPAQVPKRGHGTAIETITSVNSVTAQESHGAETEALPHRLFSPEPDYPAQQYRDRVGGRVKIRIRLDSAGRVVDAKIYASSGVPALDEAALEAVWKWRFEPSTNSRPTVQELVVPIRFAPPQS